MKKITFTIMFLFGFMYTFNGLQAQVPEQVHSRKTDQEVQRPEGSEEDLEYNERERAARNDRAKEQRRNGQEYRKDKSEAKAEGESCKDKKAKKGIKGNADREAGKRIGKFNKGERAESMKAGKEDIKSRKKGKHHPIFYRRANARNGKGEPGLS